MSKEEDPFFIKLIKPGMNDFKRPLGVFAFIAAYFSILLYLDAHVGDTYFLCLFSLFLYYYNAPIRRFGYFMAPFVLTGMMYDSMRYIGQGLREAVHVAEPYLLEKELFGITLSTGEVVTPNEFLQNYTHWIVDLITGFGYITFIFVYILLAIYFIYKKEWLLLRKSSWAFFIVNLMGYITYHIYPAAPPWYVEIYGFGPVKLDAPPSPAGALRFDELLGVSWFQGMYGKSANVFGAIPSLHVTYPFIAMVYSLRIKQFQWFYVPFCLVVCFAAVYLNHHYIIDVLLGLIYATLTLGLIDFFYKDRSLNLDRFY